MTAAPTRRPGGVTFLGVLVIISGILYVIAGLLALLASASSDLTSNQKTVILPVVNH